VSEFCDVDPGLGKIVSQAPSENPTPRNTGERLRVLLFTNSVQVGGMEEHVELLARHLDRKEFEVFAICPESEALEPFVRSLQAAADHFAQITPDERRGKLRHYAETARLTQQIRRWRIDVVHMHSTTYRGQYHALMAARLGGARAVYVTEHLAPEQLLSLSERAKRDAFTRMVDGLICVSKKNFVARSTYLDTPNEKALVVNNGVDLDDFPKIPPSVLADLRARHELPNDALVVGTVVRFEPGKGLEYLVDAMPSIRAAHPNVHLLMVGDGSLRAELEAHVERLGLKAVTRFVGFQKDPRPYLAVMDAFVLPVPVGSMSIGLLEAMAMARPVVITFGGEGEAVVDGETGFCAEPKSSRSIADSVNKLFADRTLRSTLGSAARQRVAEQFSAQEVARILGQVYLHGMPGA
jgi:glycosyltransferase involved in cell wall biosynthesis